MDNKDYDSEKLSKKGNLYLNKLQNLQARQQQLTLENTYIYMAFGQSLVGSNNIPCTAR